jgi:DNA polymerase III subunit delta'
MNPSWNCWPFAERAMNPPWNFALIPGMEEDKALLRQLAGEARIPHALLFLGDYGTANLALALAFARLVLCREPVGEEPCEQCPACLKSVGWVHPDLHFSYPVTGEKALSRTFADAWRQLLQENPYFTPGDWFETQDKSARKQGNINVDECKQIIQKMSYTAVEGSYKILLLWGAEFLGKEGNRLLKLIEEPPDQTLFLIIGADADRILPTILSRCQLIKVRRFRDEEIREALLARSLAGTAEADQLAFLADGNMHEALLTAASGAEPLAGQFLSWMRACYQGTGLDTLRQSEQLAALVREEQKTFFQYALHFVRQMILAHVGKPERVRLSGPERDAALRMASLFDLGRLEELGELFSAGIRSIERNANARILFTHSAIQVHALFRDKMRYLATTNDN